MIFNALSNSHRKLRARKANIVEKILFFDAENGTWYRMMHGKQKRERINL
jgi:hypothetical protein